MVSLIKTVCRHLSGIGQNSVIFFSFTILYFKSGRTLLIDNKITVRKFYAAANVLYSHVKSASEATVLFLVETFCLPLLTYASETLNYSKQQ